LFKFLKKWISSIITVILILLTLVFAGKIIISPADNLEAAQKQSETNEVDNINNPTDSSEGYNKAYFAETNNPDFSYGATVKSISEEDDSINNPAGESEEDKDIIKEEAGEKQEAAVVEEIKDEDNDPDPIEEPNIDFTSSDDFRIDVDLAKQKVFVYYKDNLIRDMICSGGKEETPTPTGEFKTSDKIEYSFVDRFNMGAYYWTRFYKKYLFHSVPYDKKGEMITEEYEKLGRPASHGCIRLEFEEAKWLYENLPSGVKVQIH